MCEIDCELQDVCTDVPEEWERKFKVGTWEEGWLPRCYKCKRSFFQVGRGQFWGTKGDLRMVCHECEPIVTRHGGSEVRIPGGPDGRGDE